MKKHLILFLLLAVINRLNAQMNYQENQIKTIGSDVVPIQQPVLVNGGDLPPINVFHNPLWMSSNKPEESNQSQSIQKLNEMNAQLDAELQKYKKMLASTNNNQGSNQGNNGNSPNTHNYNQDQQPHPTNFNSFLQRSYPKFTQSDSNSALNLNLSESSSNYNNLSNNYSSGGGNGSGNSLHYNDYYSHPDAAFPKLAGLEPKFLETKVNFLDKDPNTPLCIRREGMLKIRDADQKDKDVVVTYAVLTKERLSYFVNPKDESSIQGSIELDKIRESLKLINGFASCFTVKTLDNVSDCSICAESEDSAREWINAITQNAVNCNTLSALNNLNKRGLLK